MAKKKENTHILDQMYFIEGALDNPLRRHTVIFFHKIFFQRSTVDADTDRNTALFCGIHHCAHTLCTSYTTSGNYSRYASDSNQTRQTGSRYNAKG